MIIEITDVNSKEFKDNIEKVRSLIDNSKVISVLSGAGVSTASGIKDFRGKDGIYNTKSEYAYTPEEILDVDFFNGSDEKKEIFWNFYRKTFSGEYEPNIVHNFFKELEDKGKEVYISTQNIDGLHEKTGNKNIYAIHGNANELKCMCCGKKFDLDWLSKCEDKIPVHKDCDYILSDETAYIEPNVVLYGQMLNTSLLSKAEDSAIKADLYFVIGSSLYVYPANNLPILYLRNNTLSKDASLVIINMGDINPDTMHRLYYLSDNIIYFNCNMLDVIKVLNNN